MYIKVFTFLAEYAIVLFMIEKPLLESAQERATRIWRNNQITRSIQIINEKLGITQNETVNIPHQEATAEEKSIARSIKKYALEIFIQNKHDKINYYMASIKSQKRRLMLEKLKRLERDQDEK
jgi:hypothetical protein